MAQARARRTDVSPAPLPPLPPDALETRFPSTAQSAYKPTRRRSPDAALRLAAHALDEDLSAMSLEVDLFLAALHAEGDASRYAPDLPLVERFLRQRTGQPPDLVVRRIGQGADGTPRVLVAYLSGLVDASAVQDHILSLVARGPSERSRPGVDNLAALPGDVQPRTTWTEILRDLTQGHVLVFRAGDAKALSVDVRKPQARSIGRPVTEIQVRGPDEAFNEVLDTQISQLRRRFPETDLRVHVHTMGSARTRAAVVFLEGVANPAVVAELEKRLERAIAGHVVNATVLASLIRDHRRSIFPTVRSTERVDLAASFLAEGKVALLVDGDPFVLLVPAVLSDFFRTSMDFSSPWFDASFARFIRLVGWFLGLYLPGMYLAFTDVNVNVMAPEMLITVEGSRVGIPLTPLGETLLMILIVEVLREAALRLPKILGVTIGTMGAIVLGTAIVKAGLVSPQIIVVITMTALSLYSTPVYDLAASWRLLGFLMILIGDSLGVLGITLATVFLVGILVRMTSFGSPYFTPFAPFRPVDWLRIVFRGPWSMITARPTAARPLDPGWPHTRPVDETHLLRGRRQSG